MLCAPGMGFSSASLERFQDRGAVPGLALERALQLIDDPIPLGGPGQSSLCHQGSVGDWLT